MTTTLDIRPVTSEIGAEIHGIDLAADLDEATVAAIRQALLDHLVLFFGGQDITPEEHIAFARRFGEINVAPFGPKLEGHPEMTVLDQVAPVGGLAARWHTDNTYMPVPPMGSILRCAELPQVGGDTCWASMYAAYDALSEPLKGLLGELTATHDITYTLTRALEDGLADDDLARMRRTWPPVEHPVVVAHPETGRPVLYVNANFTTRINGVTEEEGRMLLRLLLDHVRSPDFQVRLHWEPGTVAFWDNRCVQHYAVPDYAQRRVMQRVTIEDGIRPRAYDPRAAVPDLAPAG